MSQHYNDNQGLVSLPGSLQQSLQRIDSLLTDAEQAQAYGNPELATVRAREAIHIISGMSPELGTLLAAGQIHYNGYDMEIVERVDSYHLVERNFLGLRLGHTVVNTPTITKKTIRGRLF